VRDVVADAVGHQQPQQGLGLQRRGRHRRARVIAQRLEALGRERVLAMLALAASSASARRTAAAASS
jgi:hypothetical protein